MDYGLFNYIQACIFSRLKLLFKGGFPVMAEITRILAANIRRQFFFVKATSHSTIFDIPMRPLREDQKHRHRFTR